MTAAMKSNALWRRVVDSGAMITVSLACVLLLVYIAYGTTKRTYEQLLVEKSLAQAELVRTPLETYLRPGLPLRQFTGYKQLTTAMIESDRTLISMIVELTDGELVFSAGDAKARTLPPTADNALPHGSDIRKSEAVLQLILPLRNKFEQVGNLVVTMDRLEIDRRLVGEFRIILAIALLACLSFGLVVFMVSAGDVPVSRKPVVFAFTGAFLAVAIAVVVTMISLFTDGAESKGRALADSLGQRLDDIPQYGLQFDQIDGLDQVLDSYRTLNPEISSIGITINGRIAVHTDRSRIGNFWVKISGQSEYQAMLTPANHPRAALVILSVPRNYVFWQVARNVKNYTALFVASALFAFLFLQLAQAMRTAQVNIRAGNADWRNPLALDLVKPIFFLAVFVDNLSYAFLPQVISDLARAGGHDGSSIAWPFTAYYLCFALALIPTGHYSQSIGTRNLVLGGLGLVMAGLAGMAVVGSLNMAVVARAVTGLGQGVLFIGVQSYILAKALRENRTKANGIIVYGFQGGMISGMAIGSLLAGEIGAAGVFIAGAAIAAAAIAYTLLLLPSDATSHDTESSSKVVWSDTMRLLRDPQFLQIILMVGMPAKAVLTGVVLFAMPLLLHATGFAKEDIAQITMIYAGSVIISSAIASHIADRTLACRQLLVWGGFSTALGLIVISISGHDFVMTSAYPLFWKTSLIVAGSAIIGLAHGLINAPVVTHITDTAISRQIGQAPTAAAYRLLERLGHMLGPVIVGQLFLLCGTSALILGWIGIFMAALATAFHFINPVDRKDSRTQEFA